MSNSSQKKTNSNLNTLQVEADLTTKKTAFLFKSVHPASLGVFRMFFGVMMFIHLQKFQPYMVDTLTEATFFIQYEGFEWVKILSKESMQLLFSGMFLATFLVIIGLFFRAASFALFLGWGYCFFICKGHYNNHYYLYVLLPLLLSMTNADSWFSVKNWFKGVKDSQFTPPKIPYWQLFLLQFQLFIVYFYGGLAKLNIDWLNAYPPRIWISELEGVYPLWDGMLQTVWFAYFMSYSGLLFDLIIGFMLFSKSWRIWALPLIVSFHIGNHFLWSIGTFPWTMMGATVLFFRPDQPQRFLQAFFKKSLTNPVQEKCSSASSKLILVGISVYFAFQLLFPLRHYVLYEGNPAWHGYAHLFSWRMMLVTRNSAIRVKITIPDKNVKGEIDLGRYITPKQLSRLGTHPRTFKKLADFVNNDVQNSSGNSNAEIYIVQWKSLNARPYQLVIDSTVNLVKEAPLTQKIPVWIRSMENLAYKQDFKKLTTQECINMGFDCK